MNHNQPIRVMDLRGTYKGGGGPDKTILLSAKLHDPKRVHVLVTYLRDPKDNEFEIHKRAAKLGINYVDVRDRYLIDLSCVKSLNRLIKQHDLRIVHTHDDKTLLYGWILKKILPGLRIMYTCHSHACYSRKDFTRIQDYLDFFIRNQARIFLMKRYQKPILTVSENTKSRLVKDGLRGQDIEVLANGIDFNFWKKEKGRPVLKEELQIPPDGYLVGTVARIDYDKDLSTFFQVTQAVVQIFQNVKFVIVGDGHGNELQRVQVLAEEMGVGDHVFFTGHRNDILDIYASMDIFLMTSLTEGMPNTVLEAMSMEIPIVSTSVGGVPDLVDHGKTGFLADVGDHKSLSTYVLKLLKDNMLRQEFACAGRERIKKHFSFDQRVKKLEKYYELFAR